MTAVRTLPFASLPPVERALARRLSASPMLGDPDRATLSDVEVRRAWAEAATFSPADREALGALSVRLGVEPPSSTRASPDEIARRVADVFGPARTDARTGRVLRKMRIVATVGPSCTDTATLANMIGAGMDVARVNFSHVRSADDARGIVDALRAAMRMAGRDVRILADLPGPKIRMAALDAPFTLQDDAVVRLGAPAAGAPGPAFLPIDPPAVLADVQVGDRVFIDDGKIALRVTATDGEGAMAQVVRGGEVKSKKGINLPDSTLTERVPTADDVAAIAIARSLGITLFAASFVEDAVDVARVRAALGPGAQIVTKVERLKALANLDEIFAASDAVMVARGDLAVEIGDADTPVAQARMHALGNHRGTPTGTATQMLESMTSGPRPTRAEASDVHRSVVEGAEFVMTSGETAVGDDPVGVLKEMARIIDATELAVRTGTVRGA